MIYKGHDLRLEKSHIRITNLQTGVTWTEDTLKDAKNEIDTIDKISIAIADEIGKAIKQRERRKHI